MEAKIGDRNMEMPNPVRQTHQLQCSEVYMGEYIRRTGIGMRKYVKKEHGDAKACRPVGGRVQHRYERADSYKGTSPHKVGPMYVEADVTTTQLPVKAASGARPYMPMGGRHQHADVEHPQSRRLSTLAICVLTGINSSALHRMSQPATLQL
jgi:hypothetical protein